MVWYGMVSLPLYIQKQSLKTRLSRALELHRAGLPITDVEAAELLFRERVSLHCL